MHKNAGASAQAGSVHLIVSTLARDEQDIVKRCSLDGLERTSSAIHRPGAIHPLTDVSGGCALTVLQQRADLVGQSYTDKSFMARFSRTAFITALILDQL